jgi:hypothetical protein
MELPLTPDQAFVAGILLGVFVMLGIFVWIIRSVFLTGIR